MPIVNNTFIADENITGRTADGRSFLILAKGRKVSLAQAKGMGLVTADGEIAPHAKRKEHPPENKQLQPVQENKSAAFSITDSALELANEHGIDVTNIEGSGVDGRILMSDIKAIIEG